MSLTVGDFHLDNNPDNACSITYVKNKFDGDDEEYSIEIENIPVGQRGRVSPYATGRGQELQEVGLRAGYDLGEFGEFSGRGSITPEGEGQARLEYTTDLDKITKALLRKRGGKVTKKTNKRKTKKYAKGCVVRTAKY